MMVTSNASQQIGITPHLARTKQTLEHFQISHMTLYRWERQDGFPTVLRRGNIKLFNIAAIERWLTTEGK